MVSVDWEQAVATGHILAAFSALLVGAAVLLLPKGTHTHAGLVAAGCDQLAAAVDQVDGAWGVPVAIGAVLLVSGVVIFWRVPSTLDRMLAER